MSALRVLPAAATPPITHRRRSRGRVGGNDVVVSASAARDTPPSPSPPSPPRLIRPQERTRNTPQPPQQLQYGPSRGDPDSYDEDPRFGVFKGCNDEGVLVDALGLAAPGAPGGGGGGDGRHGGDGGDGGDGAINTKAPKQKTNNARRSRLTPDMVPALRAAWSSKCASGASGAAVLRFAEVGRERGGGRSLTQPPLPPGPLPVPCRVTFFSILPKPTGTGDIKCEVRIVQVR